MVNKILRAAGVPYDRAIFREKPRPATYAVYMDSREVGGADGINCLITHHITIELYATKTENPQAEALEAELDAQGLEWTSQGWYWLPEEQRYQEVYEFTYIEKRRVTHA